MEITELKIQAAREILQHGEARIIIPTVRPLDETQVMMDILTYERDIRIRNRDVVMIILAFLSCNNAKKKEDGNYDPGELEHIGTLVNNFYTYLRAARYSPLVLVLCTKYMLSISKLTVSPRYSPMFGRFTNAFKDLITDPLKQTKFPMSIARRVHGYLEVNANRFQDGWGTDVRQAKEYLIANKQERIVIE